MPKAPTPATKTACLPSAGYDYMRATKHRFVKAVETSVEGPLAGTWEDVWMFVFACESTGAERYWGYESKSLTPSVPEALD